MERLTYIDNEGWYANGENGKRLRGPHIDRLAAYEGTRLEPEEVAALQASKPFVNEMFRLLGTQNEAAKLALAALRAQEERERNDPLTLEELREMDGEPVWVTHSKYGKGWCIIDWHGVNKSWTYFSKTGTAEGMAAVPATAATYGETWLAYRYKSEPH